MAKYFRLRFSLRTLLLLITVPAVFMGWQAHRAHRQRLAVATILERGGWVEYDWEPLRLDLMEESANQGLMYGSLDAEPPGPQCLRRLLGDEYFQSVTSVRVDASHVDDTLVKRLKELPTLEWISVRYVDDEAATIDRLRRELPGVEVYAHEFPHNWHELIR